MAFFFLFLVQSLVYLVLEVVISIFFGSLYESIW